MPPVPQSASLLHGFVQTTFAVSSKSTVQKTASPFVMSKLLHSPPPFVHGCPTPSSFPHFGTHAVFGGGKLKSHGWHLPASQIPCDGQSLSTTHSAPGGSFAGGHAASAANPNATTATTAARIRT